MVRHVLQNSDDDSHQSKVLGYCLPRLWTWISNKSQYLKKLLFYLNLNRLGHQNSAEDLNVQRNYRIEGFFSLIYQASQQLDGVLNGLILVIRNCCLQIYHDPLTVPSNFYQSSHDVDDIFGAFFVKSFVENFHKKFKYVASFDNAKIYLKWTWGW